MTGPAVNSTAQAKAEARARIRAMRQALPSAARANDAKAMAAVLAAANLPIATTTIAVFRSLPTEPDTGPIIERCQQRDCRILLPAVRGTHLDWTVLPAEAAEFTTGVLGISELLGEPIGRDAQPLMDCSLVLVPCLAVDARGRRLGQGGGYYDRILSTLPAPQDGGPLLIAVCFPNECGIDIPVEEHDAPVHACLTSAGLRWFTNP